MKISSYVNSGCYFPVSWGQTSCCCCHCYPCTAPRIIHLQNWCDGWGCSSHYSWFPLELVDGFNRTHECCPLTPTFSYGVSCNVSPSNSLFSTTAIVVTCLEVSASNSAILLLWSSSNSFVKLNWAFKPLETLVILENVSLRPANSFSLNEISASNNWILLSREDFLDSNSSIFASVSCCLPPYLVRQIVSQSVPGWLVI